MVSLEPLSARDKMMLISHQKKVYQNHLFSRTDPEEPSALGKVNSTLPESEFGDFS